MFDADVPRGWVQTAQPTKAVRAKRDNARAIVNAVLIFFVVATALNLTFVVANYRTSTTLNAAAASSASPAFKSRYDSVGAQVVEAWLTGGQPVIATASGLTWPTVLGEETTGIDVVSVGYLGGRTVALEGTSGHHESLSYVVVAADGSQYTATVDIGVLSLAAGEPVSPVLLSAPLVEPRGSVAVIADAVKPSWQVVSLSAESAAVANIERWVDAWVTNDGGALKTLTGDNSSSPYSGLTSTETWSVVEDSVTVLWAATRPSDGNVVARVMWTMQTALPDTADGVSVDPLVVQKTISQSADLLIGDVGSGLPTILAWGGPGTYADLVAYQNAAAQVASDEIEGED